MYVYGVRDLSRTSHMLGEHALLLSSVPSWLMVLEAGQCKAEELVIW